MTKGAMNRMVLSTVILLMLTACGEIEGIDYLRMGHPADPDARHGQHERISQALAPELVTVHPDAKAAEPTKTGSAAEPMDHSMHGGGR